MNNLQIIIHNNERVLTTSRLAEQYGTAENTIVKNFSRNKERYEEGKHYFCIQGKDLTDLRAKGQIVILPNQNKLSLWTEKGALLHAKSLNTDKAWQIYEFLVDNYFNPKQKSRHTTITDKQAKTLEIKETNARVRLSNQFLKLAKIETLSEEYKNILVSKAAEALTGFALIPLPPSCLLDTSDAADE